MGQFLTVSNSMRAKDREGNPKSWESQYGTFEVWNVYFQGDDTKYQVNKKPGFGGYEKGQQVYGTATVGQYGGRFKQEQAPDGVSAPASTAQSSDKLADLERRVATIEAALEATGTMTFHKEDVVLEDIKDGPVDLSEIEY